MQHSLINPLVPNAHESVRIAKMSILKLGSSKKIPMSVATMSR